MAGDKQSGRGIRGKAQARACPVVLCGQQSKKEARSTPYRGHIRGSAAACRPWRTRLDLAAHEDADVVGALAVNHRHLGQRRGRRAHALCCKRKQTPGCAACPKGKAAGACSGGPTRTNVAARASPAWAWRRLQPPLLCSRPPWTMRHAEQPAAAHAHGRTALGMLGRVARCLADPHARACYSATRVGAGTFAAAAALRPLGGAGHMRGQRSC